MTARNEDFLFAQEAQNLGYVTEAQVQEGFLLQGRMSNDLKIDERLAVILVKRGWLAEEQARRVYAIIEPEGARTQIEGYRLVQKVGRGAMGTVYKAIHKGLHRVVAIKILRRDLAADKTQIERLKREAQLLADLDHPNIVRAFDAGESNGFPYLVMEYVEGDTLREYITKRGTLGNEEALRITRALADALEKARRMGIVHRDVKPGNILINKSGTPKLMDLGLAKGPLDPGLTQHGATVGTPQFMSPEQAESPEKADTRSDIYSLGATLYAMVTGRPPFEGSTLAEIITKVMSQQPVPPRVRNAEVSPEVSHLIERMMLKDATLRYATPADVVADVDLIRGGQSIIPRGFQGNWEAYLLRKRFLHWRRRIVIGLAAALVLGVGAWIFVTRQQKQDARTEVDRLAYDIQKMPAVTVGSSLEELERWYRESQTAMHRIARIEVAHNVSSGKGSSLQTKVDRYAHDAVVMRSFVAMRSRVREIMDRGSFALAQREFAQHKDGMQYVKPAAAGYARLGAEILRRSREGRQGACRSILARSATSLDAFETKWRDHLAVYDGPWVRVTASWSEGRRVATVAAEKAAKIAAAVAAFDAAYAPDLIARRVAALEFYELKRDVRRDRDAAEAVVHAHLEAWPEEIARPVLVGRAGIVPLALAEPERRVDRAVHALWRGLIDGLQAMPLAEARQRLDAFTAAAERGNYYGDLAARAAPVMRRLVGEIDQRAKQAQAAFDVVRTGVLDALRRGDADEIEQRVDASLALGTLLSQEMRGRVRGLRMVAPILRAVEDAALEGLARKGIGRVLGATVVRSADGGANIAYKQFRLVGVDVTGRTLRGRVTRPGTSRKEQIVHPIRRFRLDHVLAWAQESGLPLDAAAPAFIDLALLSPATDVPGRDLRVLVRAYRRAAQLFATPDTQPWRELVEERTARLERFQRSREDQATRLKVGIQHASAGEKYNLVRERYALLADAKGRLRDTEVFDANAADLGKLDAQAHEELKRRDLLSLFEGGVDVRELEGGRHRIQFDFDDLVQLRNFDRGFAEARPTHHTVTPREDARSRELFLLPGVRGVLRDRPLSLRSMFDPNEELILEFRLRAPRASSILAIDMDGVQIAIASADPNWWRRRFPPGVPLLDDEEEAPAFDFYGFGRGIAFHEGKDFGSAFPHGNWNWSRLSSGRNFERWKSPSYLQDHRAELFAFEPAETYVVRVERLRSRMRLFVNDELIVERTRSSWADRGGHSDSNKRVRQGSGRIQILTWTPLVIDDLVLEGKVSERWKRHRRIEREAGK